MKKLKLLGCLGLALTTSCVPCFGMSSCASSNEITSVDAKRLFFYSIAINETGDGLTWVQNGFTGLGVYLFNRSQVPYISVEDYVNMFMKYGNSDPTAHNYSFVNGDKSVTIVNDYNNASCVIDFVNKTMTFNDYDSFLNVRINSNNPFAAGLSGGEKWFVETVNEYTPPAQPYVIDLNKYNIKAYYFNNMGFLPFDLFRNILDSGWNTYWFYTGTGFYELLDAAADKTFGPLILNDLYKPLKTKAKCLTRDFLEFGYNLLALTLDTRYGLPSRESRSNPGQTISYFPNGAYEALNPYHQDLVSPIANKSNDALISFFKTCCDDGGHTSYQGINLLNTKIPNFSSIDNYGPEYIKTGLTLSYMDQARSDYFTFVSKSVDHGIAYHTTMNTNDTLWVHFDSFTSPNAQTWEDEGMSYDTIDNTNYVYDTVAMTMYLQKLINMDSKRKIKYVILDLACNGGGSVYAEHFISSYLCGRTNTLLPQSETNTGGVTHTLYNPHTMAFGKYTTYADINQDGQYNELDYLPNDVKLYCITSEGSFSCGNMLPNDLATCGDCKFIGAKSGGGACFLDNYMHLCLGNVFTSSSNYHMLKNGSTLENIMSVDSGNPIPADGYALPLEIGGYSQYFDPDVILPWIKNH